MESNLPLLQIMFQTLTSFDPYLKKMKRTRLVKTDRVYKGGKTKPLQPPNPPPESC